MQVAEHMKMHYLEMLSENNTSEHTDTLKGVQIKVGNLVWVCEWNSSIFLAPLYF